MKYAWIICMLLVLCGMTIAEQSADPFARYVIQQGDRVVVDADGVTLPVLLDALGAIKPFHYVVDQVHDRTLSVHLAPSTWRQALHRVILAAGMTCKWQGDVLRVFLAPDFQKDTLKQVHIKAYIVSMDEDYFRDLGIKLQVAGEVAQEAGERDSVAWLGLKYIGAKRLGAALSAMEGEGHGKVLSSPELVTLHKHTAFVETGDEVPISLSSDVSGHDVIYKKAVLRLNVTPEVMGNEVSMAVHIVQDKLSPTFVKGHAVIHTRQIDTVVRIKNHETVALGGIYEWDRGRHRSCIPWLKKIPILGVLFCRQESKASKHQLMVFMTPSIL